MANGAIKGITVEIGGDTTKLGKAIGDTEKKSRSLQVELRQIEKLLKFDPTNTELLAQKQDVLKSAIEETSKKLDTLKEAEAQVIAQFERGEIAENQLRAFQREILQTEKDLSGMKSELSSTETAMKNLANGTDNAEKHTEEYKQAVADAKEELSSFKEKAGEAFDTLKTGATVLGGAVVATGGYALKLSTDFDKAFNTLITRTGASKDEMDELNTAMENVYANNFGESIEDVAQSMATVKQNTKLSGDELQSATEKALLMRDTFEFDVNESTRSAKMLMDQYGISAEEAYNLIAQGAQNGLDKNGDLLDTINEYGVHFSGLGLSAEDMFNMLVNGAEGGTFSVDKLGDAVKEFGIRVKDGSDGTTEAFKMLGLDVDDTSMKFAKGGEGAKEALSEVTTALFNMDDPLTQNQVGVALFGTMWEDLGADGVKALMNLEGEVSTSKDALEDINNTKYDDIGSALQGLGRTLETDVVKPLGDELKPVVEDAIEYVKANGPQIKEVLSNVVEKVGEFVGFVVDHGDAIVSIIAGIGAGFVLWNVVSMITGVVNAIKAFKLANEGATVAQMLLNAVMNANPIGILITVIGAIVVAITSFILTNEDARAKFVEIWNKIKEVASTVVSALATFFTETIPNAIGVVIEWFKGLPEKIRAGIATAVTVVTNIFNSIRNAISTVVNAVMNIVSAVFNTIKTIIEAYVNAWKTVITTVWNAIKTVVTGAVNVVKTIITTVFDAVKTYITTVFNVYKTIITGVWTAIKTSVTTIINGVKTTIANVFNIIKTTISTVMTTIKTTISNVWNTIKSTVSSVVNGIKIVISSIFNAIKALIRGDMNGVKSNLSTAWNAIKNIVSSVVNGIKNVISTVFNGIKSVVSTVTNGIKSTISSVWNGIKSTTSNVFNGIKTTMSNALNSAKTSVVNACKNIFSGMKNAFSNIGSTFRSIGSNVINGIKNGISGAVSGLYSSIKSALSGLVDKAKDALGIHSPSRVFKKEIGENIVKGLISGIDAQKKNAKKSAEELSKLYITSANSKLKTLEKANKITLAQEETYWKQVAKHCKKGTTGYEQALANAKKAKKDLNESLSKLDKQYSSDVESVKTKLKKDIQDLTDAYNEAVSSRQKSIISSLNLFDKFEAKDSVSKDDLTTNLKSQVEALKEWDTTLDTLRNRKGMDSGLLSDLENMGVDSLETLKSLNSMSDKELSEYVSLYKEKNAIALERAEAENESLKRESDKQIKKLIKDANTSLNKLETTYKNNLAELGVSVKDQSKSIGKNIVDGLKRGIESQNENFKKYLKNFLNSIVNTSKKALSIKSPSRVFANVIGKQIPAGIAQGIDDNVDLATDSIRNMSDDLINSANIDRKLATTFNDGSTNIANDNKALLSKLDSIYERLSRLQIVLDTGTLVGEAIDKIDTGLANKQLLSARGV